MSHTSKGGDEHDDYVAGRFSRNGRLRDLTAGQLRAVGVDTDIFECEQARERREKEQLLAALKMTAVARSAERAESLRNLIGSVVTDYDRLGVSPGDTTTHYAALDSPTEIKLTADGTNPGIELDSQSIARYNSRAKVRVEYDSHPGFFYGYIANNHDSTLHFAYEWTNPRADASAVLTVSALLSLNGFCAAHSRGGLGDGGRGWLKLNPTLDLLQTWVQPPTSAPTQPTSEAFTIAEVRAKSTGFIYSDDEHAFQNVFRTGQVSYQQAIVPPGQTLIIDVALLFLDAFDAKVTADFSSGAWDICSPFVHLAIVYV